MLGKKGTIIYIGGFEMPDKNAAANRVINNAKIFEKIGYKVAFCGVDSSILKDVEIPVHIGNFESWPSKYPITSKEWIKNQLSFKHTEYVLLNYKDLKFVIAYNMHAIPLRNLERWCKKRKIKIIIDATEWYPNKFSLKFGKFIRWIDTNLTMRVYQKKADGIIAISSFFVNYYKNSVKNIVRIPPLVDTNEKKWNQKIEEQSKYVEFIYVGKAGNGKDIVKDKMDIIINAMAKLNPLTEFHFSVVGMTQAECIAMFPGIDEKLRALNKKIDFYGRISHEDSLNFLIKSDYCIFLRERNRQNMAGFPTKFAECLSAGTGIIVNDISDIKEYFPVTNGVLVDDLNDKKITEAIFKCIQNGKVKHKGSNVFDYNRYIKKFDDFLNKVGTLNEDTTN